MRMKRSVLIFPAILLLLLVFPATSTIVRGAELTFDQQESLLDGTPVDQAYGDRVTALEDGSFRYGGSRGLTPHITVSYGPPTGFPAIWTTGYGSLTSVLYKSDDSEPALDVVLTGEDGWAVVLHGFDLAAYAADFASFPVTVSTVQVLDDRGTVLFESPGQEISETTQTRIVLDPPLEGASLTIHLDLSNLQSLAGLDRGGNASDAVGIDRIRFAERGPIPLEQSAVVTVEPGSTRLALADLDGDGDVDIVAASAGDGLSPGGVSWSGNQGDLATYSVRRLISSGDGASGVATGDLDGDGDLDVIASWAADSQVAWYENLGGNFGDPASNERTIASVLDAASVTLADLDQDGDLDVLSASRLGGSVQWHENDGNPADGGWTDHVVTVLATGARRADVSDLDRDGDLDILVASESGPVFSWHENLGGGTFGSQQVIPNTALGGRWIIAADVDGDGNPDALVASCEDDTLAWHQNLLDTVPGGFGSAQVISGNAECPESMAADDLDLDGDIDVMAATRDGAAIWYRNVDGAGTFGAATSIPFDSGVVGFSDIATADPDRDGDRDLVAARAGEALIVSNRTIHRSGELYDQTWIHSALVTQIAAADLDRDGDRDVVFAERASAGSTSFVVRIGINDRSGGLQVSGSFATSNLRDLDLPDIDGDGAHDILVVHDSVSWIRNPDGAGGFTGPGLVIASSGAGEIFLRAAAADLDRDGDADILVGGYSATSSLLWWMENDGTPQDGGWTRHALSTGYERVLDVAVADLNRDGFPDIIATAGDDFTSGACVDCAVIWFGGDSSQTPPLFNMRTPLPADEGLHALAVIDGSRPLSIAVELDPLTWLSAADTRQGDGDPDLAVGTDSNLNYYENRLDEATADFAPPRQGGLPGDDYVPPVGPLPRILVEDLNRDGRSDLVAPMTYYFGGPPEEDGFTLIEGRNVSGNLNLGLDGLGPRGAVAVDIDGDGDLDILTAHEGDGFFFTGGPGLAWHINDGGQYELSLNWPVQDPMASRTVVTEEEVRALVRLQITLRAAVGDPTARLEALDLRLTDSSGVPLSAAQANNLIENLYIYREADIAGNSATFDPAADILVGGIAHLSPDASGAFGVAISAGDPSLIVAAPAVFYVVAEIAAEAASQPLREFRIGAVPGTYVIKDALTGTPLSEERPWPDQSRSYFVSPLVDVLTDAPDASEGDLSCDAGGGACTLRAAIQEANLRPGDDEILLGPGVYTLGIPGADEDACATGDLDISDSLVLSGAGPGITIIDGGDLDRVLDIHSAFVTLENLTIRNGNASTPILTNFEGAGGGLRNYEGSLTIRNVEIRENEAFAGGGIANVLFPFGPGYLTISDSRIVDNVALSRGGGLYTNWSLQVASCLVSGNVAADHGGISSEHSVQLTNSTVSGNRAVPSPYGSGNGGGIGLLWIDLSPWGSWGDLVSSTVTDNEAVTGGGIYFEQDLTMTSTILAGNRASGNGADCYGIYPSQHVAAYSLIQDPSCIPGTENGPNLLGVDPLLGPLQDNGGPTPTHALPLDSPAIDTGSCASYYVPTDQRGVSRIDLDAYANAAGGDGCDIGAYEVSLVETLEPIEVPVRWCVVEGSPSFDFNSPTVQEDVNTLLRDRTDTATAAIYDAKGRVRFRSAASASVANFPILPDPDTLVGNPGDVAIDPPSREYGEFLQLVADCRVAWEALDPSIVGITAINIGRFVDPAGTPLDVLGVGGRAEFGNAVQQYDAGRVMVVDRVYRMPPYANPAETNERVLAHELGHAAGALLHGDGIDNPGPYPQCGNGILDDDDDQCQERPRLDGNNLMQYRTGVVLTNDQVLIAREHMTLTIPDITGAGGTSSQADAENIEGEIQNVLDWEIQNVLDWEIQNVLDWEIQNVLDWEIQNVLDWEESEILDYQFANVVEFGMDFTIADPYTGDGETTLYASTAGLPWPTPIRPPTTYLWYVDLDEDPNAPGSGDLTGGRPSDYGFPASRTGESGVDVIAILEVYSECDPATMICEDFVLKSAFTFQGTGYVLRVAPTRAEDEIQPVTLGLVQEDVEAEREEPALSVVLAPTFPNSLFIDAVAGYFPGEPVALEVVVGLPCEITLPNGIELDCQCTDCLLCPDYPGCEEPGGEPAPQKYCQDGTTRCVTDADCGSGTCGGEKTCSVNGNLCTSNADCNVADDEVCGGKTVLTADSPSSVLLFDPPVLPQCTVDPPVTSTTGITVLASDFPTDTGRSITVSMDGVLIHTEPSPFFDPNTGTTALGVTLPTETLYGERTLTVELQGFATTAICSVLAQIEGVPPELSTVSSPIDPIAMDSSVAVSAEFLDDVGDTHDATWIWGDGTSSAGTITEPSGAEPGVVTGTHEYTTSGIYQITLSLSDGTSDPVETQLPFVVIYDPDGGFVTGGGFIDSPPGAYAPDATMVGRANFGFVSKYVNGATTPTGSTEFEFKVADLRFKSSSYEWLVVSGSRAQFKGTGQIRGAGNYGFLLTAIDEKLTPSVNLDQFRIKIWDKDDNDAIVYDNRMGEEEIGDAATALSGGSIVIHKN